MQAKKSLGQNFLNSKAVARDIVRAADLTLTDTVLEIGPGKGFLTHELLASGARVVAVEKDARMIPLLTKKFAEATTEKRFVLIHGDIVELLEKNTLVLPLHYKLVANIPYYITGYVLRAFLETNRASKDGARHDFVKSKPERMILMLQKEVADRIVARDKKESILSIATKAYGTPRIVKKVPARYFTPAPKVDSAVLSITDISNKNFPNAASEKRFFEIMKTGFAHKRKQLAGNLKDLLGDETKKLLAQSAIPLNARAEDLPLEKWLALTKNAHK